MMLRAITDELKHDVVRIGDRAKLKRLVAYVRAKRAYMVEKPKESQIAVLADRMAKEELMT